jgi:hypothetical protein
MNARRNPRVVLKAKKQKILFFLAVCNAIYTGLLNHPALFPALPVLLSVLLAQIQAVESAQKLVKTRVAGAAATRDDLVDVLASTVENIRSYIQVLCDASPGQAATLAAAAGMSLAAVGVHPKAALAATLGTVSGLVRLVANGSLLSTSRRGKFFEWQYTLDGKTWLVGTTTSTGKASIAGLPPLTSVGFRVRVTNSLTVGEWTQVVSIVVH